MNSISEKIFPTGPRAWQRELFQKAECANQLIRIPTGFGKTLGVLHAWLHHHFVDTSVRWPTRLVWCLPSRVLVEHLEAELRQVLSTLPVASDVDVHVLMGGVEGIDWSLHPERKAILLGTQDMLLSRALNRGYAAARARWPMEFGLLSQDCLWVMDEVQLMDVGLATSAQLQAFWDQDAKAGKAIWPNKTWWMSATLQREWLAKSPDTKSLVQAQTLNIPNSDRHGPLWEQVHKPLELVRRKNAKEIAALVENQHLDAACRGLTLVVLNTVDRAVSIFNLLRDSKLLAAGNVQIKLVHSRFRPHERASWRTEFLNKEACLGAANRIIVATQVIEAGVDISAQRLITELAPWPALVQRFGRCARWGGHASVTVVDLELKDKAALPYDAAELDSARSALTLGNVAPLALERFDESLDAASRAELFPFEPLHLLLRYEIEELFDTAADLSGSDIDVSRFIRSGAERDLQVFWLDLANGEQPDPKRKPIRDELCAIPVSKARDWLIKKGSKALAEGARAWVWDYVDAIWRVLREENLFPGQVVLVSTDTGGYCEELGFCPGSKNFHALLPKRCATEKVFESDSQENVEEMGMLPIFETIAIHGAQVSEKAVALCKALLPAKTAIFSCVGRWHDVGKAHPAFNTSIEPHHARLQETALRLDNQGLKRHGFRHELASTLALFDVLRRHNPMHGALLGEQLAQLETSGIAIETQACATEPPNTLELEILDLSADEFDLVAYLVCCHHGKVRLSWHASTFDQDANDANLRIRGVRDGELLPRLPLMGPFGTLSSLPESRLDLTPSAIGLSGRMGRSWTDRVLGLLRKHGPFTLAYFEALIRAADQCSSIHPLVEPVLHSNHESLENAGVAL